MPASNDAPPSPEQRRSARILLIALITLSFVFIATYALRLGQRQQIEQDIAAAQARLEDVQETQARLAAQAAVARQVQQDAVAREVLQLAEPGEVSYLGVEPTPQPAPPAIETPPPPPPPAPVWRQWLEFLVPQLNRPA